MTPDIELDPLRRASTDSLRGYEAIRRAQTLTAEGEQILALAEDLMRRAGLAYLLEYPAALANRPREAQADPEGMVAAYVQMQQTYADLKDALYRLATNQFAAKAWRDGRATLGALLALEPEYRDAAMVLRQSYILQSQALLRGGAWDEGRMVLREEMAKYPDDREVRIKYLESFVGEKSDSALQALQLEEPRVGQLPSFGTALMWAAETAKWARIHNYQLSHQPSPEYEHAYNTWCRHLQESAQNFSSSATQLDEACDQLRVQLAGLIRSQAQV